MSDLYDGERVRYAVEQQHSVCRRNAPTPYCGAHDSYWPSGQRDCNAFVDHLDDADSVLAMTAPAIAARALREFANDRVHHQTAARMQEDLLARADALERNP